MGDVLRRVRLAVGRSPHCGASGWQLRVGCTDGHGGAICPLCGRPVRTRPDGTTIQRPVQVIRQH